MAGPQMNYCDDSKWARAEAAVSGAGAVAARAGGGKPSGIKGLKVCPQLDRTKWCQRLPRGHDQDVCHVMSQKRRQVLHAMRDLLDKHVDSPVCPEWDTSETCENTPGPFRFGVVKPSKTNENYKIIGSRLTSAGCECLRRNGLQDECPLPRCRGSPSCRETPFPRCAPFLGLPAATAAAPERLAANAACADHCHCPAPLR